MIIIQKHYYNTQKSYYNTEKNEDINITYYHLIFNIFGVSYFSLSH